MQLATNVEEAEVDALPRITLGQPRYRFVRELDRDTEAFETELNDRLRAQALKPGVGAWEVPFFQSHVYLRQTTRPFRLLQVRAETGEAVGQIAVTLVRSRRFPLLCRGEVRRLGPFVTGEAEAFTLRKVRELCARECGMADLRLQPLRQDRASLCDFEERARRAGFRLADPLDVTRTLLMDLMPSEDELLENLPRKIRYKLRLLNREPADLIPLTTTQHVASLREALKASFGRTVGHSADFNFEETLALAARHPDQVRVTGLFLRARPDRPVAYVTGFRSGPYAEYSSAGSVSDPALRAMPFNYWLLWDLVLWAKRNGASVMDLRGVSSEDPDDPLAGISNFKRRFTLWETDVGREMVTVFKPPILWLYDMLKKKRAAYSPPGDSVSRRGSDATSPAGGL